MPQPVAALLATDNELVTYLVRLERRIAALETRIVGHGNSATIGPYSIRADGDRLIAVRLADGATQVLADFNQGG